MKRENLALVTPEQLWYIAGNWHVRDEWNALDVLDLEYMSTSDKLRTVLRKEFLQKMLLHEFACRCEEWMLSLIDSPDPRSVEAVRVKRLWMAGEATDGELDFAQAAAREAVKAARGTAWAAALGAENVARRDAELAAAWTADIVSELWDDSEARTAAEEHAVDILRNLIDEWDD